MLRVLTSSLGKALALVQRECQSMTTAARSLSRQPHELTTVYPPDAAACSDVTVASPCPKYAWVTTA
ncbi:hypothetical protein GCM10017607_10740 [Microbacterium thalassium]|nr:hypothetical protein GCM10017607_10740 [Microbacterium thalassium]